MAFYLLFQDCKEFQGELFGICNLFRDLSDKLFTSEIIELQKEKELEGSLPARKSDSTQLGTDFICQDESDTSVYTNRKATCSERTSTSELTLEDLGELLPFLLAAAFLTYFDENAMCQFLFRAVPKTCSVFKVCSTYCL